MSRQLRVALIGFGAMGRALAQMIRVQLGHVSLIGIAKSSAATPDDLTLVPQGTSFVTAPDELAALEPEVVVECAGHEALAQFGPLLLRQGANLLVASIGALANPALEASLREHARNSGARILIPSGALGGLDVLSAARVAGLDSVTYVGRKPFRAWRSTGAEPLLERAGNAAGDLLVFAGTAREAARDFPKNANVTAAVALAGVGFDGTRVQLFAAAGATANEHSVRARGRFGSFEITVRANALPANPRTSLLAPCSLARSLASLHDTIALA
jgi:aspartate dehydrogenase